jgi:hypothetical protein
VRQLFVFVPFSIAIILGGSIGCSGRPQKAEPATEAQKAAMQNPVMMGPTGPGGKAPAGVTAPPK